MLSELQLKEKIEKIRIIVKSFLQYNVSINELSKIINIPSSTIQRYLQDKESICNEFGFQVYNDIQIRLVKNKELGNSKGGKVSTSRHSVLKDKEGKFQGVKRR